MFPDTLSTTSFEVKTYGSLSIHVETQSKMVSFYSPSSIDAIVPCSLPVRLTPFHHLQQRQGFKSMTNQSTELHLCGVRRQSDRNRTQTATATDSGKASIFIGGDFTADQSGWVACRATWIDEPCAPKAYHISAQPRP